MSLTQDITPEPLWAVYDKDGHVLTTLDNARDGSYWAYKQGLTDTHVGPWPDAGRPMLPLGTVCVRCDGTGHDLDATEPVPCAYGIPCRSELKAPLDNTRPADEPETCYTCNGFGRTREGGYAYKNEASFLRAERAGQGKLCRTCLGYKQIVRLPIVRDCYSCKGRGMRPTWDPTRPILPPEVSDCDTATEEFMWGWLQSITITVLRQERGLSWGEANLGLIGFGSCVDYGRAYTGTDESVIDDVVERITMGGEQYTKMIDRRTRIFGPALIIAVTRNGYSIYVANAPLAPGLGALPPTYFPTVFEEA